MILVISVYASQHLKYINGIEMGKHSPNELLIL